MHSHAIGDDTLRGKLRISRTGFTSLYVPLILLILILWIVPSSAASEKQVTLRGIVIDYETRQPLYNATVTVWMEQTLIAQNSTNPQGLFAIQIPIDHNYIIYIYSDSPSTSGWDYLPALKTIQSPTDDVDLEIKLRHGASVIIDNDIQFLDMTSRVTTYTWEVRDPENEEALDFDGYRLIYGVTEDAHTKLLGLNTSYLIVPAEIPFDIRVNSSAIVGGEIFIRSFTIDEPGHLNLSKGDLIHLDVRKYSLLYNIDLMEKKIKEVDERIDEMDSMGFYLYLEKQKSVDISGMVDKTVYDLMCGSYVDSFKELRRADIEITELLNHLVGIFNSAAISVFILIFFLAFTSMVITLLLFEKSLYKAAASGSLTALFHILLHNIYPGATYIPAETFFASSVIAWFVTLFMTMVIPTFLKARGAGDRVPLRNIIVPIFSLAKTGLTRRRFRSILTLSSVIMIVMSFVALTSFTMGYGLILQRISNQRIPLAGVLMRAPYKNSELRYSNFIPIENTAIEWLQKQIEVELIAPKAENRPSLMPLVELDGKPIYGFIGILPNAEAHILGLDEIMVEGRYLQDGEEDAILISEDLKGKLGVEVNEKLLLGKKMVVVVGIYRDRELRKMKDLDGGSIMPDKLINLSPPGEPSNIIISPAESDEIIISGLETALKLSGVSLSRIDIILRDGKSVNDFAERVALERNDRAWASSDDGLYIARLGNRFQGKGLPLAVPWGIVILNVIITTSNSLYERRREIKILSSVGLNPAHISGIFIAEAFTIGLIGGGLGYLLGLGLYKTTAILGITLEVRQKVSALWTFGALAIAMTAVIIGAILALRDSVIITPSLLRRWRIEERERWEPVCMTLPISVPIKEIDDFMDYVLRNLKIYEESQIDRTEWFRIWREDTEEKSIRGIKFSHRTIGASSSTHSSNRLIAERKTGEEVYRLNMYSIGNTNWIYKTGSLVRMIIMRWSTVNYH